MDEDAAMREHVCTPETAATALVSGQTSTWESLCGLKIDVRLDWRGTLTPDLPWLVYDHPGSAVAECTECAARFLARIPRLEDLVTPV